MCAETKCPESVDWGAYLMADGEDAESLRRHVATCPACRAALECCFPLEAASGDGFSRHSPDSLTARVMAVLPDLPGRSPASRYGGFGLPRPVLVGNYLLTAAFTLLLTFTNAFGYLSGLGRQSKQISDGIEAFCSGTRRAIETGVARDDIWRRLCPALMRDFTKKGD